MRKHKSNSSYFAAQEGDIVFMAYFLSFPTNPYSTMVMQQEGMFSNTPSMIKLKMLRVKVTFSQIIAL